MKKKIFFFLLLLISSFTTLPIDVLAELNTQEELSATKEAIKSGNVGEYDINISVPGKEREEVSSYNVLFVIDASTSMKSGKWTATRNAIIEMVDVLLPESSTSNVNKIGLISFGIDYHLNIKLTNDRNVFYALPENYAVASQQLLAPGRSATNIEGAIAGADQYLRNLSESTKKDKEHTYVILLTDGEANYSEEKYNFYEISQNYSNGNYVREYYMTILNILEQNSEIGHVSLYDDSINAIKELYYQEYPDNNEVTFEEMVDTLYQTEEFISIINQGVIALHNYKGIDVTKSYSLSEMERAIFVNSSIDDATIEGTYVENLFYYEMITKIGTTDQLEVTRTVAAGQKLSEVATIYTIGFGSCTSWQSQMILDPDYYYNQTGEEHYSSNYSKASTTTLIEKFTTLTEEIIQIKYKNATITDYTSKWVQPLDINGDGEFTKKDITITNNGVVIDTTGITVRKLTSEEITLPNDQELNGNTTGDIYEIKWEITEYLRSWDKFILTYKVKVDTQEETFKSNTEYKANGVTTLTYDIISKSSLEAEEEIIKENVTYNITVPTVKQEENIVIIKKIDENGDNLSGADFAIEETEGTNHVIKEYSNDGETWTTTNENNAAVFFKYSGLYDYLYNINETITPNGFETINGRIINFSNQEGQIKYIEIINETIKGTIIVHYIDDEGNVLNEELTISSTVGDIYQTTPLDISNYVLLSVDGEENGLYIDGEIHITYIYTNKVGDEMIETPPHTDECPNVKIISYYMQPAIIETKKQKR